MKQQVLAVLILAVAACAPGGDVATPDSAPSQPAARAPAPVTAEAPGAAAQASAAVEPAAGVIAEEVAYGITDERNLNGYIVLPGDAIDLTAVILIHEWWGLNDNIRDVARRLAGEGYAVLAVDLFGGETATTSVDADALVGTYLQDTEVVLDNLRQAYSYVDNFVLPANIVVIGFALGGGWALEAGIDLGDGLDAVVNFYGRITTGPNLLSGLKAPILGIFAENDEAIPLRDVQRFRGVLRDLGKAEQVVIYPDVSHGFMDPGRSAYDAAAAEEAWAEMLTFLSDRLN